MFDRAAFATHSSVFAPDLIGMAAKLARNDIDFRAIRDARQRIANGTHSQATKDHMAAYADDGDDEPEPPGPAGEPRVNRAEQPAYGRNAQGQNSLRVDVPKPVAARVLPAPVLARDMRPRLSAGGSLIKGLLDEGAMSVIYAASNVGKSFLMLDIAFHIATGMEWRGLQIKKPGAVLYIASEGGYGFINRVVAIKRHYGFPDDANTPLAVLPCPVDMLDPKADRDAIVDLIEQVSLEFKQPVVLLVMDTLSRIMAGGDENGPKDMTAVVANIDSIRQRSNVHTAIVHHSGKDIAKGARGHSSLRAATDTEIELTRTGEGDDKTFTVAVKKQRELSGDETFVCCLKSVHLGADEDGDAVTSAIVEHVTGHDQGGAIPKTRKNANDIALSILADLIASQGQPLPSREGYPSGLAGVTEELWRRECDSQRLSKAEADTSRDRVFRRIFDSLHMKHAIGTRDGLVWMVRPPAKS